MTRQVDDTGRGAVLDVVDLRTQFPGFQGIVRAVNGVNISVKPQETLGLVGESGCGKSITARSIMRLIPPPGQIVQGQVLFEGKDLMRATEAEMRAVRGARIAMIFQNPRGCLNPLFSVEQQFRAVLQAHSNMKTHEAMEAGLDMLKSVGIVEPPRVMRAFPHELSTGMCQRVMIGLALSCSPTLLIADEPTTGLDVTIQVQILKLIKDLVRKVGSACILITHDLGVVAETCDRVAVMYGGRVVESGETTAIFDNPVHPYTQGLLASTLRIDRDMVLHIIPGIVPDLTDLPPGCTFEDRCDHRMEVCHLSRPQSSTPWPGHMVECHLCADKTPAQARGQPFSADISAAPVDRPITKEKRR